MSSAFWRANTALNVASDSTSVPVGTRGRPDGPATAIAARVTVRAGLRLGQIVTRTMLQKRPCIRALASEGSLMAANASARIGLAEANKARNSPPPISGMASILATDEAREGAHRREIGRASCRERVCQYV